MKSVSDIISKANELQGIEVTVYGLFTHDGITGFLYNEVCDPGDFVPEDYDQSDRIEIVEGKLLKILFSKAAAYGGGALLYCDKTVIQGKVGVSKEGIPIVNELSKMVLTTDGENVEIL